MPIVPLFGHEALAARLADAARSGSLPGSLLLHGPAGVGKQRLALHLARTILCTGQAPPCGSCQGCRFMGELTHPDLHWYFPRPRLKAADPDMETVDADVGGAIEERVEAHGLYAPPSGSEALHVATIRAMLRHAGRGPALAHRKLFVVGDAEQMAPSDGQEQAANAFLKLLEEPPADTTIILTSSEPGALLPTIRSRVVAVRVPALADAHVREFISHPSVRRQLGAGGGSEDELVRLAAGAPGRLLTSTEWRTAASGAERLMEAVASGSRARWIRAAASLGGTKARGGFASTLDHLLVLLHRRLADAVSAGSESRAARMAAAVDAIELARERARGNVNPQLTGLAVARALAEALR